MRGHGYGKVSSREVIKLFNSSGNKITAILLCVGVIAINLVFVIDQVQTAELNSWYMVLVGEL